MYNGNEIQIKEFADGTGLELYDFNARAYDYQIGRFNQIDPLSDEENQESVSTYHFSKNDPIRYNDPDGKCPTCLIGAIVGGAVEYASQVIANKIEGKSWSESLTTIDGDAMVISMVSGALSGGVSAFVPKTTVAEKIVAKGVELSISVTESLAEQTNLGLKEGKTLNQSISLEKTVQDVAVGEVFQNFSNLTPMKNAELNGDLDRANRVLKNDPQSGGRAQQVKKFENKIKSNDKINKFTQDLHNGSLSKIAGGTIDLMSRSNGLLLPVSTAPAIDNTFVSQQRR